MLPNFGCAHETDHTAPSCLFRVISQVVSKMAQVACKALILQEN